jgi:cytochrome c
LVCSVIAFTFLSGPLAAAGHDTPSGREIIGAQQFERQCAACHVVRDPAGNILAGNNGRIGPNLYGLPGRVIAGETFTNYSDALLAIGRSGLVWTEDDFVGFVQHPNNWVKSATGESGARSKMAYRVRDASQAADIFAYLAALSR